MKKSVAKYLLFFIISGILILIDQFTKRMAFEKLYQNEPVIILDNVLELVYVENRGAAFGILQNKQILFYILTVFVILIILYYLHKINLNKKSIFLYSSLLFIFSGAIGNFVDRVRNKYVVDFIYFKPIDFPVFNFADICITVGSFILIISLLFIYKGDEIKI